MVGALNAGFAATNVAVTVSGCHGSPLVFTSEHRRQQQHRPTSWSPPVRSPRPAVAASFYTAGALTKTGVVAQTVDEIVASINANALLTDKVTASNDSGRLRISNLSTGDLTLVGATAGGVINGDIGVANTTTIGGNVVRRNLVKQYNDLRDQLNKLADDASFNGINLLRGDKLRINFNELGTSSINIQAQDEFGTPRPINTITLGITCS